MEEKSKIKHKKSKKNEVSDTWIREAEQGGKDMAIEGCKSFEKEDVNERKNGEGRDKEKKKQKKKKVREDSNEGIVESDKANEKGEVGEFTGLDLDRNINKNVEKKKNKREKDKIAGGSGYKLQEIDFEDAEGNGQSTANGTCGIVIQHEKAVETLERGSDEDPVGKVGKKKRKREKDKVGLDEGASQQDSTQLTESGEQDRENQNGKYFLVFDEGCERKIIEKSEKKKRKREKGNEMDGSAAARAGILAKENNQGRADSTMNEEDYNVRTGNTEGKSRKAKSVVNGFQDSTLEKSSKKVRFSADIEVFSPSDVVGSGTGKDKDTLVKGKRFSKAEDEIVKQAVYNYIEENCLGGEGLKMVLNCRSHPKVRNCWKDIGTAIPYRPCSAVYSRAQILFRRSTSRKWTDEEYEMVLKFHEQYGPQLKVLADELGKHRWHVKDTFRRIKPANLKKGSWTQEECQTLFKLVNMDLIMKLSEEKKSKHGMLRDNICWTAISEKLSTRSGATCCLKWYNQLTSPMVAEGKWADAGDYRLINALYQLDASCIEDVNWDNLLDHRSGDVCRKRWNQMVLRVGQHGTKSFVEQVEVLANRYSPDLLDARVARDNKPVVS